MNRVVVFTVIHPGILPFVPAWARSVAAQTAPADVHVVLQGVRPEAATAAAAGLSMTCVEAGEDLSIADVRNAGFAAVCERYDTIVCVDADDELEPHRVGGAVASLTRADVSACAMSIIDAAGRATGERFTAPADAPAEAWIVGRNVFGLSNTAYRAAALAAALPVPSVLVAVDWYLATLAAASGARLVFEPREGMRYRRYGGNLAPLGPPYTPAGVRQAFERVLAHYGAVLAAPRTGSSLFDAVGAEAARVRGVFSALVANDGFDRYTEVLNQLPPGWGWWSHVADPRVGQGSA